MQNVGLFTAASSTPPSIPSGTIVVETSGYATEAKGAAVYTYDSSLTSAPPRSAFADISGRVFRLADAITERTPYVFGAVGDGSTDDSAALQAFFDDAIPSASARSNFYNLAGSWAVSQPIYAAYPNDDMVRKFRGGRLLVLPVPTGGVPIQDVLTITGTLQHWEGEVAVTDGLGGQTLYGNRRFYNGVRLMQAGESYIEAIRVDGARRDGVFIDGRQSPITLRGGTAQEIRLENRNNIGLQIGLIYARGCGSCHAEVPEKGLKLDVSSKTQGANTGVDNTFVASTSGYENSLLQRTKLNVGSTAELALYDIGKMRREIFTSKFTSIAADATAKTLTWTAGDPLGEGLRVGDRIRLIDDAHVGANAGTQFEILSFSGTNNSQIGVYPAPATETAKAYTQIVTDWSFHQIVSIESASEISVSPWVPDRANSKYYSMHGFVTDVRGEDTANVRIGYSGGLVVGGNLRAGGLYGTKVETLLSDYGELGIQHGLTLDSDSGGNVVEHIHTEGVQANILQATGLGSLEVKGTSLLQLDRCHRLVPRSSPAAAFQGSDSLSNVHVCYRGQTLETSLHGEHSGNNWFLYQSAVSNTPAANDVQLTAPGGTVELDFDYDMSRLFGRHTAELFWIGTNGAAPSGTLTFQLSTQLSGKGWTIVGNPSVTAQKPCLFKLRFYPEGRQVFIARFDAA